MRILILGGTAEARALAGRLVEMGHEVVTSLAGRTQAPKLPHGNVRVGGFGGIAGLEAYLRAAHIERIVDATHPYAGTISANATAAAQASGIPLVRLMRAAWEPAPGDDWTIVESFSEAADVLPSGARVLVTTGHTELARLLERDDCRLVVRLIERPSEPLPGHARLLLARPPHRLDGELALMRNEAITHLVTKNSGGEQTRAKLEAARQLGVKVVMIARPAYGPAREVANVEDAIAALELI
jgi:precorrin-6A/cobalt-precorrin-6A reductase